MIQISNVEVFGWQAAVRGMRNPMNSWSASDSDRELLGEKDFELAMKLSESGTDHRKFMRMIIVQMDILAPRYWWTEYDTYKVGTVANSTSTMHKIHSKEFVLGDFSYENMTSAGVKSLLGIIKRLNVSREFYLKEKDKAYWWDMIQLLPQSYNQLRTVSLNYEVLCNMYHARKHHKLDEWVEFCEWVETLPYSELITKGA